jgi:hypothetical protein
MAGGLGDAWRPELHPRDRFGRFRSKWKLSGSAERLVDSILSSFNPVQFKSEDEASNWLSQRVTGAHAKGTMPGKPPTEVAAYLQHSVDANAAIRAGHDSPEVSGLDKWWEPSDEAMILTRVVGPEAFGLNTSNSDAVEEWTGKLVQDHAPGSTNLGTPIQAGPGDITMYIAAPKGTNMIVPGNGREVLTSPDTTYRITHVQRNANGGHDALAVAIPGNSKGQGRVKQLGTKLRPAPLTEEEKADVGEQAPFREVPNAPGGAPSQQSTPEGGAANTPLAAPVKKARAPRKPKEPNPLDQPPPGEEPSKLTGKTEESAALHAWMQSRQGYPINPTPKDVQITRDGLDQQKVSDIRDAAKNLDLDLPPVKGTTKEDLVDSITHQLIGRRAGTPEKRGAERLSPDTHAPSANAMHSERRRAAEAEAAANAIPREKFTAPPAGQAPSEAEIRAKAVEAHQQAVEAMRGDRPVRLLDIVKKMSDAGVGDADINAELQRMLDSGEMRRGSADGTVIHHPLNAQAEERAQILSDLKAARKATSPEAPATPETPARTPRKTAVKAAPTKAAPAKAAPAPVSVPEEKAPETPSTPPAPSAPEPVKASLAQDATALRVKQNLGDNPDETKLMKGALDHEEAANHFRTLARNSENRAGAPESKKTAIAHYKAMAQLHQDEAKSLRERAAKARTAEEKASAAEEKAPKAVETAAKAPKAVETASGKATPELSMPEHTRPSTRFADNALKDAKKNLNKDPDGVVDKLRSDAEQLRSEPVEDPRDLVDNLSDVDSETMHEVSRQDAEKLDEIADQLEKAIGDSRENAGKANALERKAAVRRETRNRSAENPVQLSDDSKAALERAKAASDRRLEERRKEEEAKDAAARAKFEPWLKAAGVKESDLSELQQTGLMIVAGNTKLSKPEMIRRLRTKKGDTLLDRIADAAEGTAPAKKAVSPAPSRPPGENSVMLAARTRQAHIDKTRPLAELAAALNERHHETVGDPDHPRIMRNDQRVGLKDLEKELPDLAGDKLKGVDELRAAGPDELAAKAEEIAKRNGITLHGSNGDVEPFDPKRHKVLGNRPEIGSPVQVIRPGTSMDYNGEHVSLDKAVVHSLDVDEAKKAAAEGRKVDPKLLPKTAAPTAKTATPSPSVSSGKRSDQLNDIAKSADVDLKALGPKGLEGLKEDLDNPKMTRAEVAKRLRFLADRVADSGAIQYGGYHRANMPEDFQKETAAKLAESKQRSADMHKLADAIAKAKLAPHAARTEGETTTPETISKLTLPEHAELSTRRADNSVKEARRMLERGDSPAQVSQHLRDAAEAQRNDPVQDSRDIIHNTVDRDPSELRAMNRGDVTALNTLAKKVEKLRPTEPAAKKAAPAPAPARPEIPLADTADYERRVAAARAAGTINDRQVRRALAGDREAQARVIKTATPSKPKVATSTTPRVHDIAPAQARTTGLTNELVNHVRDAKDETEALKLLAKTQLTTLRAIGRENGVPPFTSRMKKADMIYAIVSHVRGGGSAPAVPAAPSREDRVAAHLLRRAEESQPGSAARILNDMPAEHRQLVKDAVDRVTGTKTPAATAQVKKAPSTPDVVPDVSTADVRGAKPVSEMNKDELLDEAYNRGIANPTQYTIAQLRGLLGLPGGGGASSGNGLKMSDKPLIPNTWGTGGGPVHFHESGAIGRALRFMGNEKRLDVGGEPLANVLGRIATDGVTGRKTTQQVLDSLKEVNAKLPKGSEAHKELTNTIEDLDAPPRHIQLPETTPAPLQKLMDKFSTIPLARRTHNRTTGKAESRNEMDELKQIVDDFAAGKISGFRMIKNVNQIQNRRHESQEGRMEIDRAVREAVKELEAMGLSTMKPST